MPRKITRNVRRPKRFLTKLRGDLEKYFDVAEAYYREMVEEGRADVPIQGNLEELLASTPGLVLFYKTIRTDAQQVRRWMETALTYQKAEKYKWFQSNEGIRDSLVTATETACGIHPLKKFINCCIQQFRRHISD